MPVGSSFKTEQDIHFAGAQAPLMNGSWMAADDAGQQIAQQHSQEQQQLQLLQQQQQQMQQQQQQRQRH